jgi:hypothetical protein
MRYYTPPKNTPHYSRETHVQINTRGIVEDVDNHTGRVAEYDGEHVLVRLDRPTNVHGEMKSKVWLWEYEISPIGG